MPELPEVETVRRSLEDRIVGRTIAGLYVGDFPGVVGDAEADDLARRLTGRCVQAVERRGKYLIVGLDDGTALLIHLRMTGQLIHTRRTEPPVRFERLAIALDDGFDLRFADQRKFGRVLHVDAAALEALYRRLGPEPLDAQLSVAELARRLQRRTSALKSALLDQTVVAGLGNIYADEALFRARLHPQRCACGLSRTETARLLCAIRAVLTEALANRGTTFASYRDGAGAVGGNQRNLRVYGRGRTGEPCPRCGQAIIRILVGGRGSHICPRCQPLTSGCCRGQRDTRAGV